MTMIVGVRYLATSGDDAVEEGGVLRGVDDFDVARLDVFEGGNDDLFEGGGVHSGPLWDAARGQGK